VLASKLVAATALSVLGMAANAVVIDFNELAIEGDGVGLGRNPITSAGYRFACSPASDVNCLGVFGRFSPFQGDPGYAAVYVGYEGFATVMTELNGSAFDFHSIDLTDVYNLGSPTTVQFTFNYAAGGSSTTAVTTDSVVGMETFVFAETGLTSVSWVTTAGSNLYGQFDNVNTAMVPEPSTYGLLMAGLLVVGAAAARRGRVEGGATP
jgi:PEP-CTERM motif